MQDLGKLILRLMVGGLMLFHGVYKIREGIGAPGTGLFRMVADHGMPEFVAYGVFIGEVVAPALLVLGLFTRISAVVVAINMAMAIWLAHPNDLWKVKEHGDYFLELQAFYLLSALAIACLGGGRFALTRKG